MLEFYMKYIEIRTKILQLPLQIKWNKYKYTVWSREIVNITEEHT